MFSKLKFGKKENNKSSEVFKFGFVVKIIEKWLSAIYRNCEFVNREL